MCVYVGLRVKAVSQCFCGGGCFEKRRGFGGGCGGGGGGGQCAELLYREMDRMV